MFSRLHNRLGSAGLVVAVVALVAALAGTAFAASKLNGTQKKEVEKIAKKFAGKDGANGANGTNGAPGANGKDGTAGAPGAAGKSVVLTTEPPGLNCEEGGTKVEVEGNAASKKYVCNGEEGEEGPEGSPWTAGGTLPTGKTETGDWVLGPTFEEGHPEGFSYLTPISFPIPLVAGIAEANIHFKPEGYTGTDTNCPGTSVNPKAKAGHLCVYTGKAIGVEETDWGFLGMANPASGGTGASTTGTLLNFFAAEKIFVYGTWAVTAP